MYIGFYIILTIADTTLGKIQSFDFVHSPAIKLKLNLDE